MDDSRRMETSPFCEKQAETYSAFSYVFSIQLLAFKNISEKEIKTCKH